MYCIVGCIDGGCMNQMQETILGTLFFLCNAWLSLIVPRSTDTMEWSGISAPVSLPGGIFEACRAPVINKDNKHLLGGVPTVRLVG